MTTEHMDSIFMQMPLGYACHEIISGNSTHTQDYVLAEANDSFFQYLGLDRETALQKNVTSFLDLTSDAKGWHLFYENINTSSHEKPMTASIREQTFKVTFYQPDTSHLITLFDDMTDIYRELQIRITDHSEVMFIKDMKNNKILDRSLIQKQQKRILYLSSHDPLTDLFNRTYLEKQMTRIDKTSMLPVTVIMGDVNGLKVINDSLGHKTGDLLLKEVAKIVELTIKNKGISARWGGDEFLILLPHIDIPGAHAMIHRLEDAFQKNEQLPLEISVSLGFDVKQTISDNLHQSQKKAEEQMYCKKLLVEKSCRSTIINTLLATLYEKSMETEEHALRLETSCIAMAEKMELAAEEKNELSLLAMLHDIGKVGIHLDILKKPGPLNEEEWREMKRHPEIGCRIVQNIPELSTVADYILFHHERFDGTGYPKGLKGDQIPLFCRILSVADSYDAMTNSRAYRKAMNGQEAMKEIKRCSGTQFDPEIVSVFLGLNTIF